MSTFATLIAAVALAVAVTAQAWVPFATCVSAGNTATRCVLYVEKTVN